MPQPIPELYAKVAAARKLDRDRGRTPSGEITLINRFSAEYRAGEVRTAYRAVLKDEQHSENRWRREYDSDGSRHDILIQQPGEACTSDDAEAHAEKYLALLDDKGRVPVVSDLDEPPLVRAVRRAFAEADAAGRPRPGRPALVTLTGATEHQVRVVLEQLGSSEPEPAENTPVTVGDGQSPFESIKRVRPDGSEYWSARELVPLMGYSRWEYFETPVQRAMASAANVGMDVASHFLRSQEMVERQQGGGLNRNDYELSREAAYLVAMNGDPNKPEIAAAQGYFVVQTRRAELELAPVTPTVPVPQSGGSNLARVAQMMRITLDEVVALESRVTALEEMAPVLKRVDQFLTSTGTVYVVEWAKSFGKTEKWAFEALRETGVLFKDKDPDGRPLNLPMAPWMQYFVVTEEYKNNMYFKTPKITPEGQVILKAHLERHGYELS